MNKQATVTIPATSANLGPGYDCLGLALALYNQVSMSVPRSMSIEDKLATHDTPFVELTVKVQGIDAEKIPTDASNLVVKAADLVFNHLGKRPRRLCLHLHNNIPVGSGLGSSSAAVLGGMFAANALVDGRLTADDIFLLATELEGHPDNVAPAIYGGLVLGIMEHDLAGRLAVTIERLTVPPLRVVIVLPDFSFSTADARAALPHHIPSEDAVFNASRLALLIRALQTSDYSRLRQAMQDRLHQPYRLPLIPGSEAAIEAAYSAGAAGVALSGAGPSLLAIVPDEPARQTAVRQAIGSAFATAGLSSRSWVLSMDQGGCQVSVGAALNQE